MLENLDKIMHLRFNFDACPMHSPFGFVHLTHQNLSARALFCLNSLANVNTQLLIYKYRFKSPPDGQSGEQYNQLLSLVQIATVLHTGQILVCFPFLKMSKVVSFLPVMRNVSGRVKKNCQRLPYRL